MKLCNYYIIFVECKCNYIVILSICVACYRAIVNQDGDRAVRVLIDRFNQV